MHSKKILLTKKKILIFDLGYGTLDISICNIDNGLIEVKAKSGYINICGRDFDIRILEYCIKEFRKKTSIDIGHNINALRRLNNACEKCKINLSMSKNYNFDLESLYHGKDFDIEINRNQFNELCRDLFKKNIDSLEAIIKDCKISKNDIDDIILVGGSSRIPLIQEMIKDFFGGKELNKTLNVDEAMLTGASIYGAVLNNIENQKIKNLSLLDITPYTFGIEVAGGIIEVFILKNSVIPKKETKSLITYNDNQFM